MAIENQIKVGIVVSSNGTTETEIKQAKALKAAYDAAAASATGMGGTAGSRSMAAAAAPGTSRGGAGDGGLSGQEYGRARGSAGITGASARDFANQSQGLGGLVRLYATYAANVFAVSAAFSALKQAADTTNLVSGLNSLGAVSGKSLGALSKQLVAATDGAISFREAMAATAATSTSGMTNENIRRLAGVAKTASLALGVSMPDALNRLSRGITKLEPELLDELGLFTKIGPATEKYALEVGKAASQLTDFERRQAFANAVIEEGEKKFSALADASANPYDKLLASLKNVAQTGLELVNKVLVPIVSLLSQSPTALGAGLLAVASVIIRQALPAIGQFKEGLKTSADAALAAAKNKAGDAVRAREQLNKLIEAKVEASADFELKKFEALEAQLTGLKEQGIRKRGALYKVLEKDIVDITDKEIRNAERSVKALEGRAVKDPSFRGQAQLERSTLEQLKATIAAEEKLTALRVQNKSAIEEQLQSSGQYARLQKQVGDYELKARKDSIIANTAYNSSLLGIRASWQLFRAEVAAADLQLKLIPASILFIRGAMASLTSVAVKLGDAINKAFFIITIVSTAFSIFDAVFSKAGKEIQKFDNALDTSKDSIDNVKRTLDALKDSKGIEQSTIQTTFALSNAMTEVADTAKAASKALEEAAQASGWWEDMWDGIKSIAGKDRATELSKVLAKQIFSALELLRREGLDAAFKDSLKSIFNVQNVTEEDLPDLIKNATQAQRSAIQKLLADSKNDLGNLSSTLQKFKESSDTSLKSYKEFLVSTADTNPLFKLGQSLVDLSVSMQYVALESGSVGKAFDDLVKNPQKAALFGSSFVTEFAAIRGEFEKQTKQVAEYDTKVRELSDSLQVLKSNRDKLGEGSIKRGLDQTISQKESELAKAKELRLGVDTSAIQKANVLFTAGIESALRRGMEYATRALTEAQVAAGAAIAKASAAALSGPRKIEEEAKIQRQQLVSQLSLIDSNISLIDVESQLVAEIRLANALAQAKDDPTNVAKQQEAQLAKASLQIMRGEPPELVGLTGAQQLSLNAQQNQEIIRKKEQTAQRTRVRGEISALDIGTNIGSRRAAAQEAVELASLIGGINKQYSEQIGLVQTITGLTSKDLIVKQSAIELAQLETKQAADLARINEDIKIAQERATASDKDKDTQNRYLDEVKSLQTRKGLLEASQKLEKDNTGIQTVTKLLQTQTEELSRKYELERSNAELLKTEATSKLDYQAQEFNLNSSLYDLSKDYVINKQAEFEKQKAILDTNYAIQQAESALNQKRGEAQLKIDALKKLGYDADSEQVLQINTELERQVTLTNNVIGGLQSQLAYKNLLSDKTKEINLEQEKYNKLIESANIFAEALKSAFGGIGEKIGAFTIALAEISIQSDKNAAALKLTEQAAVDAKDAYARSGPGKEREKAMDNLITAETAYTAARNKSRKDEMAGDIKLASSAKGFFKEKTIAYKAFHAVEMGLKLASFALEVKTSLAKVATWWAEVAAKAQQQAALTGIEGAGFFARLPFYISSIYGSTIGQLGPIAGPVVATALVAALLAAVGGGGKKPTMPAGFTAEAQQKVQGTGQAYDASGNIVQRAGGVLGDPTALADSVTSSIDTLSKEFFGVLGSGSSRIVKSLEAIRDNTDNTVKALLGKLVGVDAKSPFGTTEGTKQGMSRSTGAVVGGGIGYAVGGPIGAAIGSAIGNVLSKWWGKTTTTIADAGIVIQGTLDKLTTGLGNFQQYENTITNSSSWFGLVKSTSYNTQTANLQDDVRKALTNTFASVGDILVNSAQALEGSGTRAIDMLSQIPINLKVSTKGMNAEDAAKAIMAEISVQLNAATEKVFPYIAQYQKIGEELYETVARIVKNSETVATGLSMIGKSISGLSAEATVAANETLIAAAGGIDKFATSVQNYFDNFLSAAEKFDYSFKALTARFKEANIILPKTKAEYKALVDSLNPVSQANELAFLLNNAEAYNTLLNNQNSALQETIKGLEDSISKFKDFAKTLKDFRSSLVLGAASTATPTEKYLEAKAQFDSTYANALAGDATAMGKLTGISQTFLDLSKQLYASSDQYTQDFNMILDKLDTASTSALASADVEQLKLDYAKNTVDLLSTINENIAKIAGVPAAASGGRVSGVTLVGEMGPELVDFNTPGRVYTAEQTAGMFGGSGGNMAGAIGAMVVEVQQLRAEVTQLRRDQQKQTGDIIISNYDANQKASETVATAVQETSQNVAWTERSKSEIM